MTIPAAAPDADRAAPQLARRLGAFDATMLVMGGIVGAGIFANPSVVARAVGSPGMILLAWTLGGLVALAGAFVYAELAVWRPHVGGQYVYLRDAFHPAVAFLYGWTLLLVVQTGGMAAAAMIFGEYLRALTGLPVATAAVAVATLAALTVVNCLGARTGSTVQNAFMVTKIVAIVALVTLGWLALRGGAAALPASPIGARAEGRGPLLALAAAMVPVLFAYGGWQTASFVSGELRDPARDLPRGLLWGVAGVVVLYLAVNVVCLAVLGADGLAATSTPASDVMQRALGPIGARLLAAGIAVSTVGFLSQSMLTAPRVYFAMARDGLFFRPVGAVHPRTRAPVVAIALQGVLASAIALSGAYDEILSYVVAMDALFFGLTGAALLVFRTRERRGAESRPAGGARMPGHPATTLLFTLAFWALAASTIAQFPRSAGAGALIMLAGVPAYLVWRRVARARGLTAAGPATRRRAALPCTSRGWPPRDARPRLRIAAPSCGSSAARARQPQDHRTMPQTLQERIEQALRGVHNPRTRADVVRGEMVRDVATTRDGKVRLTLILDPQDDATLVRDVRQALERVDGVTDVRVDVKDPAQLRAPSAAPAAPPPQPGGGRSLPVMDAAPPAPARTPAPTPIAQPNLGRILAVSSGKGGVGKSTVAVNLAVALARAGHRVGLMDADIYGPNIPRMMGVNEPPPVLDQKIQPLEAHGVKLISLGFLIERDQPAIWRGPIVMKVITQFLRDVEWGQLDYFVVDMPPGTGDAQLSLVQATHVDGAVIVTTPQEVAAGDALRGAKMFERVNVPVLGIVENMSYFESPDTGKPLAIFGSGGGQRLADELDVPLLGNVPLYPPVLSGGDTGTPIVVAEPSAGAARALTSVAEKVAAALRALPAR